MLLLDIKKAFLYGSITRSVYIELPPEDPMSASGRYVGKLDKTMYGTRDAPAAWQEEVERTMTELGFRRCVSTPCLYAHPDTGVYVVAHVDDMMCVGDKEALQKFKADLEKKYKLTSTYLGPGTVRGVNALNGQADEERQEGQFL